MEQAALGILWDFDGTLATRPRGWAGCLVEVLDEFEPGHAVTVEHLGPFLRAGFPWHEPNVPHPELSSAEAWWDHLARVLARAYEGVGIGPARAAELAKSFRARYVDRGRGWRLFEDTIPALSRSRRLGGRNVILSDHVPELERIVAGLGLSPLIDAVVSSAVTGYEKPHPQAFHLGVEAATAKKVFMVGDSLEVDVRGAEAMGIPAILVRREGEAAARAVSSLTEAVASIERRGAVGERA